MTTYLAITIGPIYKTLAEAKRTRAVWAASYFFSWFVRRILEEAMDTEMQVFLPDISQITKDESDKHQGLKGKNGAGLYADRLYFIKDKNTTKEKLNTIIDKLFDEIVTKRNSSISKEFIGNYMNVHIIEKTISDDDLKDDKSPLEILNQILDNKELHQNYNSDFEINPLQQLFSRNTNADNFLSEDAFGQQSDRIFKSVSEIATESFNRQEDTKSKYAKLVNESLKDDKIELLDSLIKENFPLMPHHKYFAVIYADGDNIGRLLKDINKNNLEIKQFSKSLIDFGLKAEETIADYGGSAIYLGGEDILAFVPIVCIDKKNTATQQTLFKLIEKLDKDFEDTVQKFADDNKLSVPTLSFGVMAAYYKHPLKEVMNTAHHLLEAKAKESNKNKIAFMFQKHSGQQFECILEKQKESTRQIYALIEKYCNTPNDRTDELLSSIIQKFRDNVFTELFIESIKAETLEDFFKNTFNEKTHTSSGKATFLGEVKTISEKIYNDYNCDKQLAIKNIFAVLRFIHFVNSKKDN